ncbi:PAS domain S-box protein [candidate division KSB1 bacterium]|nr:PAS domain S-box protein [candidate division KSB1 bacterium]
MRDERKTKAQLVNELKELRNRISELERHHFDISKQSFENPELKAISANNTPQTTPPKLTSSYQLLSDVLENSRMMAVFLDAKFNFIWVNRAYANTCLHEPSYFIGKKHFDLYPHKENQDIFQRVVDTGEPYFVTAKPFEFPDQLERGTTYWDWSLTPVRDDAGNVTEILFVLVDVTEQIRAKEALKKSEEKYRLLAENVGDVLWILDLETQRFRYVSPSVERLRGYTPEEVMKQHMTAALTPSSAQKVQSLMFERLARFRDGYNGPFTDEVEQPCKDGSTVWTEVTTHYAFNKTSKHHEVFGVSRDITERKRTEDALAESKLRYQMFFQQNPDGVVIVEPETASFIEFNDQICNQLGYTREEFAQLTIFDVEAEETAEQTKEHIDKVIRTGQSDFLTKQKTKHGEIRDVSVSARIIKAGDKKIYQCIWRDITDRVRAEKALREREELFRNTFNQVAVGMSILTPEGEWLQVNQRLCEILGYSAEELLSQNYKQLTHPDHVAHDVERVRQMAVGIRNADSWEKRYIRKDGVVIWARITTALAYDKQGNPKHFVTVTEDITEQKHAVEALRQSEEKFRSIFENAIIGIYQTALDGRLLNANDAFAQMFGYGNADEMLQADLNVKHDLYANTEDRKKIINLLQKIGTMEPHEFLVKKRDKSLFWISASARLVKDEQGNILYFEGASIDITERKQTEKKLQESEERFRMLFMSMSEGFYHSEVIYDEDGNPCDYRYLEVNPLFEKIVGLPRDQIIGKRYKELVPVDTTQWLNTYCDVARTGSSRRYYFYSPEYNMHFETYAYRPTQGQVTVIVVDISERKQAENALRKNEEKLRAILDATPFPIALVDVDDNKINFWSRSAFALFGHTAPTANEWYKIAYPDPDYRLEVIERWKPFLEKAKRSPHAVNTGEYNVTCHDGSVRICELYAAFLSDNLIVTFNDVTQRKQSVKALRESEEKYRGLYRDAALGIFHSTFDGKFIDVNSALARMLGYDSPEDVLESIYNIAEQIYAEPPKRDAIVQQTIRDGGIVHIENFYRRKDGSTWNGLLHLRTIKNTKGQPDHFEGFVEDITERKQAEEALSKSEAQLANALQMAHAGHWEYDIDSDTFTFNDNFYRIFRTTAEEVGGYHMSAAEYSRRFCHPDDASLVAIETKASMETTDPAFSRQLEHRILYADGEIGYILVRFFIVKDEQGRTVKTFGVNQDITERKRAEEEKAKLEAQLRRSQKLETIGTLAGGIAHDFNNILTPIMGYADIALSNLKPNDPLADDLGHILKGAIRAKDLVEQILTFSRQIEKERKPLSLHLIVKEAVKLLRPSIPTTIDIRQRIDSSCDKIMADASEMHQVIVNLCTNAYQAMEETGGILTIEVKQVEIDADNAKFHHHLIEAEYVRLTVSDTGVGMDDKTLDRIFEPFFTTKSVDKGTGMGLSVVHGIVRKHNGDIIVYSQLGKGTTFHVYIPTIKSVDETDMKEPIPIHGGHESVLVVDDEPAVGNVLVKMLERLGYKVERYSSSIDALKEVHRRFDAFDLLISDLTMPNMTGLELAEQIRKIRSDIPVIIMTGYGDNLTDDVQKRYDIQKVIAKPIDLRELSNAIRQVIGQKDVVSEIMTSKNQL